MPRLADLQKRKVFTDDFAGVQRINEEVVVGDVRGQLSPSQVVEEKFGDVLRRNADFLLRESIA